jgi:DNA-binding transcriptional LysR family regulator
MNKSLRDLNSLRIFAALWEDRNVTKAAKRLGLSQPALSHALARLREDMHDDVFVRSGRGITPTPRAEIWAPKVITALTNLELALSEAEAFSPRTATGRVTIVGTDLIEYMLFPKLLAVLARQAPDVVLVSRPSDGSFPKSDMERGTIDFALAGFFVDIPEGFYQKMSGIEPYLTLIRKNHPLVKGSLDLKTFQRLSHILTSPQGDLSGIVDLALAKVGGKRRVVAGVTTFQVLGKLISETDFCVTLPQSMAREQSKIYGLQVHKPPLELPPIRLNMIWHQRIHTSPLHQWIRKEIQKIMAEIFPGPGV